MKQSGWRKGLLLILVLLSLLALTSVVLADGTAIVEGQSISGVSLGMTPAQVSAAVGPKIYTYGGYDVHYAFPSGTVNIKYSGGAVSEVLAKPMTWANGSFQTSAGIRTGGTSPFPVAASTPAEIEAAYPGIQLTVDNPGAGANQIARQYRLSSGGATTLFTYRVISFFCGYTCSNLATALEISIVP